jgi:hypothetical protein
VTCCAVDRDSSRFYEDLGRVELLVGDPELGAYFLTAADFYAAPSPAVTDERITLLLAAMGRLNERTSR